MPKIPKPEDDLNKLRSQVRVYSGGCVAAFVAVGASQATGYEPAQAFAALGAVATATAMVHMVSSGRARIRTVETIQKRVFTRGGSRAMPTRVKSGAQELLQKHLGHGDRGRARPKRDRGR